jgi:RHS repeat-associated protein
VVFVYDQAGHLLGEYDRNGAALREYVWLRDTPMAMFTPDPANPAGEPLVYFIHSDHLNTPRVVVDRQNRVRWRWLAEPFGTSAPETNPSGLGVFTQNLRFPGQYADQESGLFYNYHRYYSAEGGRYTQGDPIGLAGGSVSTYAYVNGNPLSFVDPTGLKLPADSDHCKALRDKMGRKNQKLDQRYSEYTMDRGVNQLPERVSPAELLSQSRRGHRTLINMEDSSLRKVEQRYAEECEDEPPSPPAVAAGAPEACPAPNAQAAPVTRNILYGVGAAAGATAVMACLAAEPCGLILGVGAAATSLVR